MKHLLIRHIKSLTARLRNHNGQMAIFVALIFQVLFVAFAMAINIGLVVHDKINLQNAVDLSAYYAAERQAEMLNVIAHENYQIRQAFKLMAWRYNVLGTAGRTDHPARTQPGNNVETVYEARPTVCVAYNPLFAEVGKGQANENLCLKREVFIPKIKLPGVIAGFNPINIILNNQVKSFIKQINNLCLEYGAYNFFVAAGSMAAFNRDQANRKQVIYALAQNMAKPFKSMSDLDGASVEEGAEKTFKRNLSYENFTSVQNFKTFNSLEGMTRETWLHELPISFNLLYTDIINDGGGGSATCRSEIKTADQAPFKMGEISPTLVQQILGFLSAPAGNINQMSIGVEKNPWVMVYAGVRAQTKPRQIFWPFGEPVTFEATAFAQPFGGRIGPWYYNNWSSGANASSGNKVDALLPPLAGAGLPENSDDLLPNYSRYPGDAVGLKSFEAQAALPAVSGLSGKFASYLEIADMGDSSPNDPLSFDPSAPGGGMIRQHEIAAVVPDLFDLAYYSIEPHFNTVYLPKLDAARSALGIPGSLPLRGDMGSRSGGGPGAGSIGIQNQLSLAGGGGSSQPFIGRQAYWFARDRNQLLVDWVHNDSFEIAEDINAERFGKCGTYDDGKVPTPGACLDGGRTGYSVKIVSPEYLLSTDLPLGGPGKTGGIVNPPPDM